MRQAQHAQAPGRICLRPREQGQGRILENKGGRADDKAALAGKGRAAPLALGGEGHGCFRCPPAFAAESLAENISRDVFIPQRAHQLGDRLLGPSVRHLLQLVERLKGECAVGDRARLVQADHVYPRQRLYAVERLYQRIVAGQVQGAHGERHARQQNQPLRDHAQHGGRSAEHRALNGRAVGGVLVVEQDDADRDDDKRQHAYDKREVAHELGPALFHAFGLFGQGCGVVVVADGGHAHIGASADDKAARHHRVARLLADSVRLAGQQRLVHLQPLRLQHHRVRAHLVSRLQQDDVVHDDFIAGDGDELAVPHGVRFGLGEDGQLVQRALGAHLLKNAHGGIAQGDADKQGVFNVSHEQDGKGEQHIDQVEQCAGVFPHDLADRRRQPLRLPVVRSGLHALPDLRLRQPSGRFGLGRSLPFMRVCRCVHVRFLLSVKVLYSVYAADFNVLSIFSPVRTQRQLYDPLAQPVVGNAGGGRLLGQQAGGRHARQRVGLQAESGAVRAQDKVNARVAAQPERAVYAQRRRPQRRLRFSGNVGRADLLRKAGLVFVSVIVKTRAGNDLDRGQGLSVQYGPRSSLLSEWSAHICAHIPRLSQAAPGCPQWKRLRSTRSRTA